MANKVEITTNILRMLSCFFFQSTPCAVLALFRSLALAARIHKGSTSNENQIQSAEDRKQPHDSNLELNPRTDYIRNRFKTLEVVSCKVVI